MNKFDRNDPVQVLREIGVLLTDNAELFFCSETDLEGLRGAVSFAGETLALFDRIHVWLMLNVSVEFANQLGERLRTATDEWYQLQRDAWYLLRDEFEISVNPPHALHILAQKQLLAQREQGYESDPLEGSYGLLETDYPYDYPPAWPVLSEDRPSLKSVELLNAAGHVDSSLRLVGKMFTDAATLLAAREKGEKPTLPSGDHWLSEDVPQDWFGPLVLSGKDEVYALLGYSPNSRKEADAKAARTRGRQRFVECLDSARGYEAFFATQQLLENASIRLKKFRGE